MLFHLQTDMGILTQTKHIDFMTMPIKYHVALSEEEVSLLNQLKKQKNFPKYKFTHIQILLALDENHTHQPPSEVAKSFGVNIKTIERLKRRFVLEGLDVAVHGKLSGNGNKPKLDGEQQAHLIALACSAPPEGRSAWTMKLLAEKMVELSFVDSVSDTTVWRELKKTK